MSESIKSSKSETSSSGSSAAPKVKKGGFNKEELIATVKVSIFTFLPVPINVWPFT